MIWGITGHFSSTHVVRSCLASHTTCTSLHAGSSCVSRSALCAHLTTLHSCTPSNSVICARYECSITCDGSHSHTTPWLFTWFVHHSVAIPSTLVHHLLSSTVPPISLDPHPCSPARSVLGLPSCLSRSLYRHAECLLHPLASCSLPPSTASLAAVAASLALPVAALSATSASLPVIMGVPASIAAATCLRSFISSP